jgi:hypothetical protein
MLEKIVHNTKIWKLEIKQLLEKQEYLCFEFPVAKLV